MLTSTGIGAAAAAIMLALAGLAGFIWMLGDVDLVNYINGWVLLTGFVLLFLAALVFTYTSASVKSPGGPACCGSEGSGYTNIADTVISGGHARPVYRNLYHHSIVIIMIKKTCLYYRILLLTLICSFSGMPACAQEVDYRRPDFSLPDLDGKQRSISEWDGKAMIINFWATWCIPCKREIPLFNQIDADYDDTELQVLGIAVDTPENVSEYLQTTAMSYLTLVEEDKAQEVAAAFISDPLVLPFTVFLDHQGRVFWMQVEEMQREQIDVILEYIGKVDSGELSYEQAQLQLVNAVAMALPESKQTP